MGSNSKLQKFEEDRITNLPTCLSSHILSLLPTKYAVRTSSLSSKWKNQWTSITQLHFDDDLLARGTMSIPNTKVSFVNIVYRVLLHLKVACLDVFQLNCSQDYGVTHINSWVSASLSRNVKHIDLSIPTDELGLLPRCLFFSKYLVVLKLGTGFLLKVPMLISLDSLKVLHLAVKFSDSDSLSRLVSRCSVLEELELRRIIDHIVSEVKISSISLKTLILNGVGHDSGHYIPFYRVALNTPSLQYFEHLNCLVPSSYCIETLPCLDRVRIDINLSVGQRRFYDFVDFEGLEITMASLAFSISGVKFLYLSPRACELLHRINHQLPKFPCLIELEMFATARTHWRLLTDFLENSPKLASLSFQHTYEFAEHPQNPPISVPICMSYNLKIIEVKNFRGIQMELDIVRYFLEKLKCLNKLLISYPSEITKEKEAEISKKLLVLPRASTSCVVVIT